MMRNNRPSLTQARYYPLYLMMLCGVLFLPGLGARDFWAPVEPRYAEITRTMFAKGEWIVPRVNGELYTDKPILYFWLALIASKISGTVNEWTVRLPAALGGVGFVLTTYYFARDYLGARTGLLSAVILATSMRVVWEARWAHIDALFCFLFALSVFFGARSLLRTDRPNAILFSYAFMGLAVLAKGLIGIVLPGLLFGAFVLAQRDWRLIRAAKLHLGIPIFFLVTAPWFYLVSQATNGKWIADFIYVHHLQRYTAGAGHRQPFYYYFKTLPVDLLPWTIFAIPGLSAFRNLRAAWANPVGQFFLLWFLTIFVFFSLSDTKRELYLMPLLPPLALYLGCYFESLASKRLPQDKIYRWTAAIYFSLVAIAGVALPVAAWFIRRDAFEAILPVSAVLVVGGSLVVYFVERRRPLRVVGAVCAMTTTALLAAWVCVFPYLETYKSPRHFALEVRKLVPNNVPLYIYSDTMHDFNYYLEREVLPILPSPAAVAALLEDQQTGYMLIKERDLKRVPALSRNWIVASEADDTARWHLLGWKSRKTE
jgi:4-amino-4-deoxy-L-arabinose transferase-like glycosyltransferase